MVFLFEGERVQERDKGQWRKREGEENVQPGLSTDGVDVAACEEQNGVHTHRFGGVARDDVQCASAWVEMQSRSGEHAAGRWFASVREWKSGIAAVEV